MTGDGLPITNHQSPIMQESIVQSIRTSFRHKWGSLPAGRKMIIGLIAAGVVAGIVGLAVWTSKPDYAVLFSDLEPDDMQAIEGELRAAGVSFQQSTNGSSIMVPSSEVYKMRLQLANKGIPEAGNIGFEGFDKTDFGMTDFVQQLKYQRALQVELGRTIGQIKQIRAARVHIVLPRKTVFADRDEPAKASVALRLRPGLRLSMDQIDGIVHLVAGAVEGLQRENVAIFDTSGKMLSTSNGDSIVDGGQLRYQRNVESELGSRIRNMLDPILGYNKATVQVAAEIDFTSTETTSEIYTPDGGVLRSETVTDYTTKGSVNSLASGTPGVTSGITPGASLAAGSWPEYNRSESTTEYEISKIIKHSIDRPGTVTRLSVAVVLDNKMLNGTPTAWTVEELQVFQDLIGNAVGIESARDDIKVTNIPFDTSLQQELADAEKVIKRENLQDMIVKASITVVIFVFLFFVLRSLLKRTSPDDMLALPETTMPAISLEQLASLGLTPAIAQGAGAGAGESTELQQALAEEEDLEPEKPAEISPAVKARQELMDMLESDPEKVARTISAWIAE